MLQIALGIPLIPAATVVVAMVPATEPPVEMGLAESGRIAHAELRIGSTPVFIGDEHVHYEDIHAPPRIGGTPVYLDLETDDVAAVFERAAAAGARAIRAPTDPQQALWSAKVRDAFGHIWPVTRSRGDDPA